MPNIERGCSCKYQTRNRFPHAPLVAMHLEKEDNRSTMEDGILLIDKAAGCTSRDVDNAIQRLFHTRKVGHLGTLDPFATGLLVVAVNKATKYLSFLPDEEKTYEAKLLLGQKTDTGDLTGKVIDEKIPSLHNEKEIQDALNSFLGASTQIPPMTSAIKIDGKSLYKLAHKGIEVEREGRPIYVHEIALISYIDNVITFRACVSKGTYVRTLGEDIATRLGEVGHLISLRRIKVGDIHVDEAIPLEKVTDADLRDPASYVAYPRIELTGSLSFKARNGVRLKLYHDATRVLLIDEKGPIAIYERDLDGEYRCLRGL